MWNQLPVLDMLIALNYTAQVIKYGLASKKIRPRRKNTAQSDLKKKLTQAVFYLWAVLGRQAVFFIDPSKTAVCLQK